MRTEFVPFETSLLDAFTAPDRVQDISHEVAHDPQDGIEMLALRVLQDWARLRKVPRNVKEHIKEQTGWEMTNLAVGRE